jgi:hypothetical protein
MVQNGADFQTSRLGGYAFVIPQVREVTLSEKGIIFQ